MVGENTHPHDGHAVAEDPFDTVNGVHGLAREPGRFAGVACAHTYIMKAQSGTPSRAVDAAPSRGRVTLVPKRSAGVGSGRTQEQSTHPRTNALFSRSHRSKARSQCRRPRCPQTWTRGAPARPMRGRRPGWDHPHGRTTAFRDHPIARTFPAHVAHLLLLMRLLPREDAAPPAPNCPRPSIARV